MRLSHCIEPKAPTGSISVLDTSWNTLTLHSKHALNACCQQAVVLNDVNPEGTYMVQMSSSEYKVPAVQISVYAAHTISLTACQTLIRGGVDPSCVVFDPQYKRDLQYQNRPTCSTCHSLSGTAQQEASLNSTEEGADRRRWTGHLEPLIQSSVLSRRCEVGDGVSIGAPLGNCSL